MTVQMTMTSLTLYTDQCLTHTFAFRLTPCLRPLPGTLSFPFLNAPCNLQMLWGFLLCPLYASMPKTLCQCSCALVNQSDLAVSYQSIRVTWQTHCQCSCAEVWLSNQIRATWQTHVT